MIQFYSPEIEKDLTLGAEEAHHCLKVLRRKAGDIIFVTDGKGKRFECRILHADTREMKIEILKEEFIPKNWNFRIVLAVAPTKNADRMSWLVEKATEIGVDEIKFIECRNNERRHLNIERLRRNAVSAMNQSLKTFLPLITSVEPIQQIYGMEGSKFFGYCDSSSDRAEFVKEYKRGDVVIAIGPEGDFNTKEVSELCENGFNAVTFGDERLRTETAALFAITTVHVLDQIENKK